MDHNPPHAGHRYGRQSTTTTAPSATANWIAGTFHSLGPLHLQAYLDEFVFRFNRRKLRGTSTLQRLIVAVARSKPMPYRNLVRRPAPA